MITSPVWCINADWMDIYTIPGFLKGVDPDFQFRGEGWYVQDKDTLLLRRTSDAGDEPSYEVYVWNDHDPRNPIKENVANLLALPTR